MAAKKVIFGDQQAPRLLPGESFTLADFHQLVNVGIEPGIGSRIEQSHPLKRSPKFPGLAIESNGVSKQHDPCQALRCNLSGGLDHPLVVPFGQDDGLPILPCLGFNLFH